MDFSTITFAIGIITCVIGVATFVRGMTAQAQKEGVLEQKINQAIDGIEEIKSEMKSSNNSQSALALLVNTNKEQISSISTRLLSIEQTQTSLDTRLNNAANTNQALAEILSIIKKESKG